MKHSPTPSHTLTHLFWHRETLFHIASITPNIPLAAMPTTSMPTLAATPTSGEDVELDPEAVPLALADGVVPEPELAADSVSILKIT